MAAMERLFLRLDGDSLYAPAAGAPGAQMHEFALHPALQPWAEPLLSYRETLPPDQAVQERVLPDGALRLVIQLGDVPPGCPRALVAGASQRPRLLQLQGRQRGLSLTLRPGAAQALLGLPAGEIGEDGVALEALRPAAQVAELLERLDQAGSGQAQCALLCQVLRRQLRNAGRSVLPTDTQRARHALQLVAAAQGRLTPAELARALELGPRRLQQLFQAQLGLRPGALLRLSRLQACLRALRQTTHRAPWADLALDGGYYDQAHLGREFRALSGLAPGLFLAQSRRLVSLSSKTPA